jgi:hypothetical protein
LFILIQFLVSARLSSEVVFDGRHREFRAIVAGLSTQFEDEVFTRSGNHFFSGLFVQLLRVHSESGSVFTSGHVGVVEGNSATSDHRDVDVVLFLKLVKERLEGHRSFLDDDLIVDTESFWDSFDRSTHDRIEFNRHGGLDGERLNKEVIVVGHVDEGILVVFELVHALDEVNHLAHHLSTDRASSCADLGNNFADPHLGFDFSALLNPEVARSNVGSRVNQVHVEVVVVVLVEVDRLD